MTQWKNQVMLCFSASLVPQRWFRCPHHAAQGSQLWRVINSVTVRNQDGDLMAHGNLHGLF